MRASDFREKAREALRGKWIKTTLLGILAVLLGAGSVGGSSSVSFSASDVETMFEGQTSPEMQAALLVFMIFGILAAAWCFFLGSYVNVGLTNMHKHILDGENPRARMLFPEGIYWKSVGLKFMRNLFVFLWTLLLIVPGIIASYRYAMSDYILLQNPGMGVMDALQESKRRMAGRKWRMFCLQLSFIGWRILALLPGWLLAMGSGMALILPAAMAGEEMTPAIAAPLILIFIVGFLVMGIGQMFVQSYVNTALIAFFREADRAAQWQDEAREGEEYAAETYAGEADFTIQPSLPLHGQPAQTQSALSANETVAKDMFFDYKCSRRRMQEAGVLEEYDALNASPVSQMRWKREYADDMMRRFDRDAAVLDEILDFTAEYAAAEVCDRALSRIERHIRQETLPDADILNMAGRMLALLTSGAFDDQVGFVERKKQQVSDMADRLEHRLNENAGEGEWRRALDLIRKMCG